MIWTRSSSSERRTRVISRLVCCGWDDGFKLLFKLQCLVFGTFEEAERRKETVSPISRQLLTLAHPRRLDNATVYKQKLRACARPTRCTKHTPCFSQEYVLCGGHCSSCHVFHLLFSIYFFSTEDRTECGEQKKRHIRLQLKS